MGEDLDIDSETPVLKTQRPRRGLISAARENLETVYADRSCKLRAVGRLPAAFYHLV